MYDQHYHSTELMIGGIPCTSRRGVHDLLPDELRAIPRARSPHFQGLELMLSERQLIDPDNGEYQVLGGRPCIGMLLKGHP